MRRAIFSLALVAACHAAAPAPLPAPSLVVIPRATPESLGFDSTRLDSVVTYLRTQVDSAFPGAVVAVGRHGRLALLAATRASSTSTHQCNATCPNSAAR